MKSLWGSPLVFIVENIRTRDPRARHARRRLDVSPMAEANLSRARARARAHTWASHADAGEECDIRGQRGNAAGESTENLEVCQFARRPSDRAAKGGLCSFGVPWLHVRVPRQIALSTPREIQIALIALEKRQRGEERTRSEIKNLRRDNLFRFSWKIGEYFRRTKLLFPTPAP